MDVLILAGGRTSPELRAASGAEFRADVPVHGRPMVEFVIDAVRHLGRIVLVGGPEGRHDCVRVEAGESFLGSLRNGLESVATEQFLLATSDLPFLTRESVDDLLRRSRPEAMLNYPIVPIAACEQRFPGVKRTCLKLREGTFTGGNVALVHRDLMRTALPRMEQAYSARKKPLRLALMVGVGTLIRVIVGQAIPGFLPLAALERSIGHMLGAPVHAVISQFAEIGADVDSAEQYQALISLLR